jgi:hypothetical protein
MADKVRKKAATRRDRDDALRLQAAGTHGDTVLAHINPAEARLLDQLADGLLDGGGRNPTTGLLSFGMSDGESGRGGDSNPGGVGGGPAGGNTGGGIGGNTADGMGGLGGGYGGSEVNGYGGFRDQYGLAGDVYSKPGIANLSLAQMEAIAKQINDDIDTDYQGMFGTGFNSRQDGWSSPNTFGRLAQELWAGPAYNAPGRYGMPNGIGPGVVGTAIGSFVGGPMSMGMRVGDAMGRAQSQQARDDTAAGYGALGAHNSTGQDRDSSGGLAARDGLGSAAPGLASGAAGLLGDARPGAASGSAVPAMDPAAGTGTALGLLGGADSGAHTKSGLPQPVENLLMDYIWRGRQGTGFGW